MAAATVASTSKTSNGTTKKVLNLDGGLFDFDGSKVSMKARLNFGFPHQPIETDWELFREVKIILQDWSQMVARKHKLSPPPMFPDSIAYYAHNCTPKAYRLMADKSEKKKKLYITSKYLLLCHFFDSLVEDREFKVKDTFDQDLDVVIDFIYKILSMQYETEQVAQEEFEKSLTLKKMSEDYIFDFDPLWHFSVDFAHELRTEWEVEKDDDQLKKFAAAVRRRFLNAHHNQPSASKTMTHEFVNANIGEGQIERYDCQGLGPLMEFYMILNDTQFPDPDKGIKKLMLLASTIMGLLGDLVAARQRNEYEPIAADNLLHFYHKEEKDFDAAISKISKVHDDLIRTFEQTYEHLVQDFAKDQNRKECVELVKEAMEHNLMFHVVKDGLPKKFEWTLE